MHKVIFRAIGPTRPVHAPACSADAKAGARGNECIGMRSEIAKNLSFCAALLESCNRLCKVGKALKCLWKQLDSAEHVIHSRIRKICLQL